MFNASFARVCSRHNGGAVLIDYALGHQPQIVGDQGDAVEILEAIMSTVLTIFDQAVRAPSYGKERLSRFVAL